MTVKTVEVTPEKVDMTKAASTLVEMYDVLYAAALREKIDKDTAHRLVKTQIFDYIRLRGASTFYLPGLSKLENALRDTKIYKEFNGRNFDELRLKYRLSDKWLRKILKEQRELRIKELQPSLF